MEAYKYENLHAANFFISIGYYLKEINYEYPFSFNFYGNVPKYDQTIGDLLGGLAGIFFIIEFKRAESSLKSELEKPQRRLLLEKLKENKNLQSISITSHLFCFPGIANSKSDYHFARYATLFNIEKIKKYNIVGVPSFIDSLLKGDIGCSFADMEQYIELMKSCVKDDNFSASGLLINYDKKNGFSYVEFNNLNFLNKKISVKKALNLKKDILVKKTKSKGKGFGI
jgi:hypothetical protein